MNNMFSFEKFIAGALIYYPKIDEFDMEILFTEFKKKSPNIKITKVFNLNLIGNYVYVNNGYIMLKPNLTLDTYVTSMEKTIRELFRDLAGTNINEFFQTFLREDFILQKIALYKHLSLENEFLEEEKEAIIELLKQGYLKKDKQVLSLSRKGLIKIANNKKEVIL